MATSSEDSGVKSPTITLPKGGGAMQTIGEKYGSVTMTGTSSLSVPIAMTPGRAGFSPTLELSYDSGNGNGSFGFGWNLSLPKITRRTEKGLPQYADLHEGNEPEDVFILSGSEDLVPELAPFTGDTWKRPEPLLRQLDGITYQVTRYRPRVDTAFARIERWKNPLTYETHWRSITTSNVTSFYGRTAESRISDPQQPLRVFSWLISETYDDKGNATVYRYKAEDSSNVDLSQASERNRSELSRTSNRYIKSIKYGNLTSQLIEPDLSKTAWFFELVFDYGDHDPATPTTNEQRLWPVRRDPFSTNRAGFEIRMYRACHRILMFHHVPDDPAVGGDCLVRSTDLVYKGDSEGGSPNGSFIASVSHSGYIKNGPSYVKESLPPLEFEYTIPTLFDVVSDLDIEGSKNLPIGVDGSIYRFVDLNSEGLPGMLTDQSGAWYYKRNLGNAHFGDLESVLTQPPLSTATKPEHYQLMDLEGNGRLDMVHLNRWLSGYSKRYEDGAWGALTPFPCSPNVDWDAAELRFVDLTGDGRADILISEDHIVIYFPSQGYEGFGPGRQWHAPSDEESGPCLLFTDIQQCIFLADMTGDGLEDIVRIRNSDISYWPNLGYGCFGSKIQMDNAPWWDSTDIFDQRRILLADVDGTGTNDIIYLAENYVQIHFNLSGNSWSEANILTTFPPTDVLSSVTTKDLFGTGTACLIWSSPLPDSRIHYIDLMGGRKPHLLSSVKDNRGLEMAYHYTSSTKFYLEDRELGQPWLTQLPFPVQVVELVESLDRISGNHFLSRYAYHHGYYDHCEREFRGFGMVEKYDTESLASIPSLLTSSSPESDSTNADRAFDVPPVLTKTWYHTGTEGENGQVGLQYMQEYFHDALADARQARSTKLGESTLPISVRTWTGETKPYQLSTEERREAIRALKGSLLHEEIYAHDGMGLDDVPYSVKDANYQVELLQPRGQGSGAQFAYGVFSAHSVENLTLHYERQSYSVNQSAVFDPRVVHEMVLARDIFGDTLRSASIAYGRLHDDQSGLLAPEDKFQQKQSYVTYKQNAYSSGILDRELDYRGPVQFESRSFDLVNAINMLSSSSANGLFSLAKINDLIDSFPPDGSRDLPAEDVAGAGVTTNDPYRRLLSHTRTLFRSNDLATVLPFGTVDSKEIVYESYRKALSSGMAQKAFIDSGKVSDNAKLESILQSEAGYVQFGDDTRSWWVPSGKTFFSSGSNDSPSTELAAARQHFYLIRRYRNPFHTDQNSTEVTVTFDKYDMLIQETEDVFGNRTTAGERDLNPDRPLLKLGHDYRVMQNSVLMDPNRNRVAVVYDTFGLVVATAVMGKPDKPAEGDSVEGFKSTLLGEAAVTAFFANPMPHLEELLENASTRAVYDHTAYYRTRNDPKPLPIASSVLSREAHVTALGGRGSRIQCHFEYFDGLSRSIQSKLPAEPGPVPQRDPITHEIIVKDGLPVMTQDAVSPRWVGSGWIVYNNKGSAIRKFEPFFTEQHRFESDVKLGISPTMFYDPLGRPTMTILPDHSWKKTVFDPWHEETWDCNNTTSITAPRNDPNVGYFFRHLDTSLYLPSWIDARQNGSLGPLEKSAGQKTLVHGGAPSRAYYDSLGRNFLVISHNRSQGPAESNVTEEYSSLRSVFDISGRVQQIVDAAGRIASSFQYDISGNLLHQQSMEAGERWMLQDVSAQPLYGWNSRGFETRTFYDQLRRHKISSLRRQGSSEAAIVVTKTEYGDSAGLSDPEAQNLRLKVIRISDQAGYVQSDAFDFKGNLLQSTRRLAKEYRNLVDWSNDQAVTLESDKYVGKIEYDALNRPSKIIASDNSSILYQFNDAGLLDRVETLLPDESTPRVFVSNIDYTAKGERSLIDFANGVQTSNEFDPLTFRLTRILTRQGGSKYQDLTYFYDAMGNITTIRDDAQQSIYFDNQRVDPTMDYTYDSLYRLIAATGREHLGQAGGQPRIPTAIDKFTMRGYDSRDGKAMATYTERYRYDSCGNILSLQHMGSNSANSGWTRLYDYGESSQIEPNNPRVKSNRLSRTTVGNVVETYSYAGSPGLHGNITGMPHLSVMDWDYLDQLHRTSEQVVNSGTPETTWYTYDSNGARVRKVTDRQAAENEVPVRKDERVYVGAGYEVYREYDGQGVESLARTSLHVSVSSKRIALVERRTAGIDDGSALLIRYQFSNHLGSAVLELDDGAQLISYEEYTPFGNSTYEAQSPQTSSSRKRYRFAAKERDEENGFYYHGLRYYAPWLGRWTTADPIGIAGGLNLFAFCRNNPVGRMDHTGANDDDTQNDINLAHFADMSSRFIAGKDRGLQFTVSWARKDASRFGMDAGDRLSFFLRDMQRAEQAEGGGIFKGSKFLYANLKIDRETNTVLDWGVRMVKDPQTGLMIEKAVRSSPGTYNLDLFSIRFTLQKGVTKIGVGFQIGNVAFDIKTSGTKEIQPSHSAMAETGITLKQERLTPGPLPPSDPTPPTPSPAPPPAEHAAPPPPAVAPVEAHPPAGPSPGAATVEEAAVPHTPPPPAPGGSSGGGGGGGVSGGGGSMLRMGAGAVGSEVSRNLVPGVVETETALVGGGTAALYGAVAVKGTALAGTADTLAAMGTAMISAARFVPGIGLAGFGGAVMGNVAEHALAGKSQEVKTGGGLVAAAATGYLIGLAIPVPGGAEVGAMIGILGYAISKM